MPLFKAIDGQIAAYDETGDLWVVSGRIPGDDEDTTIMIQATSQAQATSLFEQLLYEEYGSAEEVGTEKDNVLSVYDSSVFIITCDKVATLVPKELGTPSPGE